MAFTTMGWRFESDLSLEAMLARINASWPSKWAEGDSDTKEYIGGALTKPAVGRIYKVKSYYIANMKHWAKSDPDPIELLDAQQVMVGTLLPLVGAKNVNACEPFE